MDKIKLNFWIDVGLAISFFICFFTGLIKWPGLVKIIGASVYSVFPIKNMTMLHDVSGLVMGLLVLVHLVLHWRWIVCATRCVFKR